MDEHTWGAFDSISDPTSQEATSQLAVKDKMAIDAAAETEYVARNAMATIAGGLQTPRGSAIAFNLLNWPRSGFVEMDIGKGASITDKTNGSDVPYEITHSGVAVNHVRFIAPDVPAFGYKIFAVQPGHGAAPPDADQSGTTLESPWYRVVLDPATGAVASIYDKSQHRELVDHTSPYRFGQYLYVTGGDHAPNNLLRYSQATPAAQLTVHQAANGRLISVRKTPWGEEAILESSAPETPKVVSKIEIFDHEKKIEFSEEVDRTPATTKEAAYFAFPFVADNPRFRYEIQNGVVDPATDLYPGAGHEWFSVQHWVSVQDSAGRIGTVMPLDAPLITLGDINRGLWPDKFAAKSGTVFSYIMNNYWFTNYRASQGGTFQFHYVVTSADSYDPVLMNRRGWEEATSLEVNQVRTQDVAEHSQGAADMQKSFLEISDPAVLVETWKPAEDGQGTILRLLDLGGEARTVTVQSPLLVGSQALLTNAVEMGDTPLETTGPGAFAVPIRPHEIVTVRLIPPGASVKETREGDK
jgi:alpha-mannosidase